ncbi:retinoblastoma-like protein 1, partial [Asbolus verrucosus]
MVLSSDAEINLHHTYTELCNKLNLESKTVNEAWDSFQAIIAQNHLQGNCVNFTSLLRHCNLSLAQFFFNIRKWSDMAKLPEEFTKRIEYLEMTFAVAYNVFKEYQPLFLKIFKAPEPLDLEQTKQHRNRKQKPVPCTSLKVFEFCWTFFIAIKGGDTNYSNDLVTLCHLLIAICDWAFKNALLADRRDLLNPDFEGLPSDWSNPSYLVPAEAPCIVSHLCTPDMITDVKYIKEYQFKKSVKNLFDQGVLSGKDDDYSDVFDASVFEMNFKKITNAYEANFLNKGDFDERIFLGEIHYWKKYFQVVGQECLTPLTGRKYLGPKESQDATPLVTATESISRLNTLLSGRQAAPSEALVQLFESCARNPTETINEIVTKLGERFVAAYALEQSEVTNRRLQLAITLFYKFVENVLQNERLIQSDISAIVEKDVFYECMFACCLEIVIYSYNSRRKFPWILEALKIQAYNFIKVIELIIRSKDKLSRDTIKHLNMIEETILSSLVWKSGSLIWEAIALSEKEIPKFEETALPGHLQNEPNPENSTLRNILNSEPRQMQSPGPSATDRFQSPVAHSSAVNRELFPAVQSNQSLLQHTHL